MREPKRAALQSSIEMCAFGLQAGCSFDAGAAERWGQVEAFAQRQRLTLPTVDAQLAATALHHGLTFVTRNTEDVRVTGVPLFNPWTSRP